MTRAAVRMYVYEGANWEKGFVIHNEQLETLSWKEVKFHKIRPIFDS